ncbi:MAG: lysophospholipid acyltransferase family protein [Thiohalomonadaceae bacterium]
MLALRSLLFYLGMWLATVVIVLPIPLVLPLPPKVRYRYLTLWGRFVLWWLRVTCGVGYRVEGREHIPASASVVLAKHQSTWETIALQSIFPTQTWVLKKELLRIPFFGWGLAAAWPIAIDRKAGREALKQVIEQGVERLRNGFWVVVFPEGTRVAPGTRGRYATGGAALARQAGVPVVPVAHNGGEHWRRDTFLKIPGEIQVRIGPAIDTAGKSAAAITTEAETWIENAMSAIGRAGKALSGA